MKTARKTRSQTKISIEPDPKEKQTMNKKSNEPKQKTKNASLDLYFYSDLPILPDVKLTYLPFFDLKATLLKPSSLIPAKSTGKIQNCIFYFNLTPQQASDISNSVQNNKGFLNYSHQIQLRLCLSETTSEQKDCYPLDLSIRVNDLEAALPPPLPTRPGHPIKRPYLPLNITNYSKITSTISNKVQISWKAEAGKNFAVSVYLVDRLDTAELMKRLLAKRTKPSEFTTGLIKEKFKLEESDTEIATTVLHVSLACPLGKIRMTNPCRASTCSHLQCFDALTFLHMNEKKSTWKCPVCDKDALYENLTIDEYFLNVIQSSDLGSDENEIQLMKDGSWSRYVVNNNIQAKVERTTTPSIEISDEEDAVGSKKAEVEKNQKPRSDRLKRNAAKYSASPTSQPENKRPKRVTTRSSANTTTSTTLSENAKRTKSSSNILSQQDGNTESQSNSNSKSANSNSVYSALVPSSTIDLTLDDD